MRLREVIKNKMEFLMAFAMKGGSQMPFRFFQFFLHKKHLQSLVEVIMMNMAEYGSRRSQQPANVMNYKRT